MLAAGRRTHSIKFCRTQLAIMIVRMELTTNSAAISNIKMCCWPKPPHQTSETTFNTADMRSPACSQTSTHDIIQFEKLRPSSTASRLRSPQTVGHAVLQLAAIVYRRQPFSFFPTDSYSMALLLASYMLRKDIKRAIGVAMVVLVVVLIVVLIIVLSVKNMESFAPSNSADARNTQAYFALASKSKSLYGQTANGLFAKN